MTASFHKKWRFEPINLAYPQARKSKRSCICVRGFSFTIGLRNCSVIFLKKNLLVTTCKLTEWKHFNSEIQLECELFYGKWVKMTEQEGIKKDYSNKHRFQKSFHNICSKNKKWVFYLETHSLSLILKDCNTMNFYIAAAVHVIIPMIKALLGFSIKVFTVFRLLTDFVCLYNYEFWLSLCKIVRSSVILLLPLFIFGYFIVRHRIVLAILFRPFGVLANKG
jgi:hypothetical protein